MQDLGEDLMHIEVVDDFSTKDDPKSVVEEIGKGRVKFYQQPENKGFLTNFDTCLQRSKGKLVHLLHGDDLVMYGFYKKFQSIFEDNLEIGAAVCRHVYINEKGHWKFISPLEETESKYYTDWINQIAIHHRIQPPAIVVKREVYEKLGGFDHRLCCACEDWEMWSRIASNYPIWYEVEPLAMYRQAEGKSLTSRCIRTGKNINDY
jgi:GT2 family glycosyltransferase